MTALYKNLNPESQQNQQTAMEKLRTFVQELKDMAKSSDYESLEKEIHEYFKAAEQEVLKDCISCYDIDVPLLLIDGALHRRAVRCKQEYLTPVGPINVERTLYRRSAGAKAVCPLELQAGIVEGRWTPTAAQQAIWVTSHVTPQEGEDLFKQFGNMQPSKSSLDRLPKKVGAHWEGELLSYQKEISQQESIPDEAVSVAVSLDGVMIPMQKNEEGKNGSNYKEASCGTISFYDDEGERLSTIQFARMPEHKKQTLKEQLTQELTNIYNQRSDLTLIKLADGAKDNWDYLEKIPIGGSLLDYYHMSEHLKAVFDCAYGEGSSSSYAQFEKYQTIVLKDHDGARKVIRAIEYLQKQHPQKKKIREELTYFRNNRHRMAYAFALDSNLPIGSGVVEATCKTLVTQRLKRSGMRWAKQGGQAILSFRSLIKSKRFTKAWELLKKNYRSKVELPENVIAFPG